jgi:hypothetical protein
MLLLDIQLESNLAGCGMRHSELKDDENMNLCRYMDVKAPLTPSNNLYNREKRNGQSMP